MRSVAYLAVSDRTMLQGREGLERVAANRRIAADTTPYDLAAIAAGRPAGKFTGAELMILLRTPPA